MPSSQQPADGTSAGSPAVSVVGLGKIGLPLAATFASRGLRVVAYDAQSTVREAVASRRPLHHEPGLVETLAAGADNLSVAVDLASAIADTDLTFIIVATPSDEAGAYDPSQLLAACDSVGAAMSSKAVPHVVVVASTVMPGTVGTVVRDRLATASGKKPGEGFGLAYVPEFYALGDAIAGILAPDFVMIGADDGWVADVVESAYVQVCRERPPIVRTRVVEAELAKVALNAFLTLKMGYANTLAALCERLPGADVDVVAGVLGRDRRIGRKFLTGATAYGGPCFPRDTRAFQSLAARLDVPAGAIAATERENEGQVSRLVEMVRSHLPAGGRVAVLGLAYKPRTDLVDESPGVALALRLADDGLRVVAHDPLAGPRARAVLPPSVEVVAACADAVRVADVVVITTPDSAWKNITPAMCRPTQAGVSPTFVDCWRVLEPEDLAGAARIISLGVGT